MEEREEIAIHPTLQSLMVCKGWRPIGTYYLMGGGGVCVYMMGGNPIASVRAILIPGWGSLGCFSFDGSLRQMMNE